MTFSDFQKQLVTQTITACLPDTAVKRALADLPEVSGRKLFIAIGKAAWRMAKAAVDYPDVTFDQGLVITKYGHCEGELANVTLLEAGHPIPDHNTLQATQAAMDLVSSLTSEDLVVVLLSGGGSALFEKPLVSFEELTQITNALLAKGADIVEINTIRKRLSAVKGGRFAECCAPAHVYNIILSDIIGDPIDMIASGPTYPDASTCKEAQAIVEKYQLSLSDQAQEALTHETPKQLDNVTTHLSGSVSELCAAAQAFLEENSFQVTLLTSSLACEAREAGKFMGAIGKNYAESTRPLAFLIGGETVVHVTGDGKGGRNQEIALAAAEVIDGLDSVHVLSFGSDGTDGPTDAAGGYSDGQTLTRLKEKGLQIHEVLQRNDAYHALKAIDQLIVTGPTGTNVNDLSLVLIIPKGTLL